MLSLQIRILLVSCLYVPVILLAQPMIVLGGSQKARQCYLNAEMAAQNLPGVDVNLLEPCTYSLDHGTLSLRDRAATLANRGIVYAAINNFDAAMNDYDKAMTFNPGSPENYINRGNAFFLMREFANALEDYEESLNLGLPQQHAAHFNMGLTFERLGNDEAAEREYLKSIEFDSDWPLSKRRLEIVRERLAQEISGPDNQ